EFKLCCFLWGKISDWRKLRAHQTAKNARHSSAKLLNLKKSSAIKNGIASCLTATPTPRSLMSENMELVLKSIQREIAASRPRRIRSTKAGYSDHFIYCVDSQADIFAFLNAVSAAGIVGREPGASTRAVARQ